MKYEVRLGKFKVSEDFVIEDVVLSADVEVEYLVEQVRFVKEIPNIIQSFIDVFTKNAEVIGSNAAIFEGAFRAVKEDMYTKRSNCSDSE